MAARVSVPVLYDQNGQFFGKGGTLMTISTNAAVIGYVQKPNGYAVPPNQAPLITTLQVQDETLGSLFILMTVDEFQAAVIEARGGGGGGDQDIQSVLDHGSEAVGQSITFESGESDPDGAGAHGIDIIVSDDGHTRKVKYFGPDGNLSVIADTSVPGSILTLPAKTGIVATLDDVDSAIQNPFNTDVSAGFHKITDLALPVAGTDAANKDYVNTFVQGLSPKTFVRVATTGALVPAGAYTSTGGGTLTGATNTVLVVDGITMVANNDVLVKDEADETHNGIYTVTSPGVAGVSPYVLVRRADANTGAELVGAYVQTGSEGTDNKNKGYTQKTPSPITLGTSLIQWTIFNSNIYTASTGVRIDGTAISAKLSEGVAGGQSVKGGTNSEDALTITGSISTDPRLTTAPAISVNSLGPLGATTAIAQNFKTIRAIINQSTSVAAGYSLLKVIAVETNVGTGTKNLQEWYAGNAGTDLKGAISNTGDLTLAAGATISAGSGTGLKVGATGDKIGFFGTAGIAKPDSVSVVTAMENLGLGSNLTVPDGTAGWTYYMMSGSDFTGSNNSTTVGVNITGLVTGALIANSVYEFEAMFSANSGSGGSGGAFGAKFAVSVTQTPTILVNLFSGLQGSSTALTTTTNASGLLTASSFCTAAATEGPISVKGLLKTGAGANPVLSIQYSKTTSGVLTVRSGGFLKVKKVA